MIAIHNRLLSLFIILLLGACSSTSGIVKQTSDNPPEQTSKADVAHQVVAAHAPRPSHGHGEGAFHIVGPGETLSHICDVYGLDNNKVARVNKIAASGPLKEGDSLFLPAEALLEDNDTPNAGSSQNDRARKEKSPAKQGSSVVANAIRGHRDPSVPVLKFPVPQGVLTSPFGYRWGKFHKGLDIAAPVGTPVLSCAEGRVIFTGSRKRFRRYGNTVLIHHGKGVYTHYAHLSDISVKKNQKVRKGQKIALVGNTGRSTGPHLHLEVRVVNNVYNPLAYFAPDEMAKTRIAKRFTDSPMGPVRAHWGIPDLLAAQK
jgi:murein DD-endopeptidase MepM/ murein hydrolase activator NlpD